jgi:hypothetical protein
VAFWLTAELVVAVIVVGDGIVEEAVDKVVDVAF